MDTLYEKFKTEFGELLKRMGMDFDTAWKSMLEDLSIKKAALESKVVELESKHKNLDIEVKKFSGELLDLDFKIKKAKENLKALEDKKLSMAEAVLAAEKTINEAKLAIDDLNKKQEKLDDTELAIKVKEGNLQEREARMNRILNKVNQK
jgi:chromosome segregation ATPase